MSGAAYSAARDSVAIPMTAGDLWLAGLIIGIALGIPTGHVLGRYLFDPVDRWLDEHWQQ